MFLVESGLVKLTRSAPSAAKLILSVIGHHQLVGEESLVTGPSDYFADVVCLTEVTGYRIPLVVIGRLLSVPEFAASFLTYALTRDRERVRRIEMLALYSVEQRVLHSLAELAHLVQPNAEGNSFPIPMTQVDIASFVGATRETTSATLSALQTRQLVTLGRRLITTVHPDHLIGAADDRSERSATTSRS